MKFSDVTDKVYWSVDGITDEERISCITVLITALTFNESLLSFILNVTYLWLSGTKFQVIIPEEQEHIIDKSNDEVIGIIRDLTDHLMPSNPKKG